MWCNFTGCDCLKTILNDNGYDNTASLRHLNENELDRLENAINQQRQILHSLNCKHAETYKSQKNFKFLSGHRISVLKWCEALNIESNNTRSSNETFNVNNPAFSPILREMILFAVENFNKPPNTRRFTKPGSNLLMDFSIYIYIMAGKASYEIISSNLPLPQAKTIGKLYLNFIRKRKLLYLFCFMSYALFYGKMNNSSEQHIQR